MKSYRQCFLYFEFHRSVLERASPSKNRFFPRSLRSWDILVLKKQICTMIYWQQQKCCDILWCFGHKTQKSNKMQLKVNPVKMQSHITILIVWLYVFLNQKHYQKKYSLHKFSFGKQNLFENSKERYWIFYIRCYVLSVSRKAPKKRRIYTIDSKKFIKRFG